MKRTIAMYSFLWTGVVIMLCGLVAMLGLFVEDNKTWLSLFFGGLTLACTGFLIETIESKPMSRLQYHNRKTNIRGMILCIICSLGIFVFIQISL